MPKGKLPAIMFYTGDWLKDPDLGKCSPATRGIWIDMLCLMHENSRSGTLQGTPSELSRACRCTPGQILSAVKELKKTGTADIPSSWEGNSVTDRNYEITIICRRMLEESKERKSNADKQKRYRDRQDQPTTTKALPENNPPSSNSSSISPSTLVIKEEEKKNIYKKKFSKPTPSEVSEYAKSIDFTLNGSDFCDYYEARGWCLGKGQPMKCWKSAVKTWKTRQKKDNNGKNTKRTAAAKAADREMPYGGKDELPPIL